MTTAERELKSLEALVKLLPVKGKQAVRWQLDGQRHFENILKNNKADEQTKNDAFYAYEKIRKNSLTTVEDKGLEWWKLETKKLEAFDQELRQSDIRARR